MTDVRVVPVWNIEGSAWWQEGSPEDPVPECQYALVLTGVPMVGDRVRSKHGNVHRVTDVMVHEDLSVTVYWFGGKAPAADCTPVSPEADAKEESVSVEADESGRGGWIVADEAGGATEAMWAELQRTHKSPTTPSPGASGAIDAARAREDLETVVDARPFSCRFARGSENFAYRSVRAFIDAAGQREKELARWKALYNGLVHSTVVGVESESDLRAENARLREGYTQIVLRYQVGDGDPHALFEIARRYLNGGTDDE